jgi:hypothetical protein
MEAHAFGQRLPLTVSNGMENRSSNFGCYGIQVDLFGAACCKRKKTLQAFYSTCYLEMASEMGHTIAVACGAVV